MTVNLWRSTVTATLERSTAWCAADRSRIEVARLSAREPGSAASAMMPARRRSSLVSALFGVGAGVLASCAYYQPRPPATTASVEAPQPPSPKAMLPPPAPRPVRKPTPPSPPGSAASEPAGEAAAMIEPESRAGAPGPTAAESPQVQELIGLDQSAATRLFGTAVERSEEPPATIWRYKTANCELDLFFYLDLRSGRMRTLHYAFRGDATDSSRRQNCLRDLAARHS